MITVSALFLVSFFLPAIAKKAGKFSLPLTKHESAVPELIPLQFAVQKRHGRTQKSLDTDPTPDTIFTYEDSRSRGNPIDVRDHSLLLQLKVYLIGLLGPIHARTLL